MPTNPLEYKYTSSHEWVSALANDEVTVGITTHAQSMLGDIVFVDLPEVGQVVAKGKEVMVLESVKAAADVYSPVAGEIVAVNESLIDQPEQVNQSPFDQGWLFTIKPSDPESLTALLSAQDYQEAI